jgi:hypothetical protein
MARTRARGKRPRVVTSCVADQYSAQHERIIEFSSDKGGGLISFREFPEGLRVEVYRADPTVTVMGPKGQTIPYPAD